MSDKTMHRGLVVLGSGNVLIGGPTVGATLGNPAASTKDCCALAATQPSWFHEVLITGVEYDENGQVKAYIINDTGLGKCGLRVSADDFGYARHPRAGITVTKAPLP